MDAAFVSACLGTNGVGVAYYLLILSSSLLCLAENGECVA